jgi:murein DD-endopeptidase MepM/ murein hydrolase activator NlpD
MKLFNTAALAIWINLSLAGGMISATASAQEASVNQGGIARWSGYAAESCGMYGKRFAAIDAVCYYPIDMKAKPGKHEVALYDVDGVQKLGWLTVHKVEFEKSDLQLPDDTYVKVSPENLKRHLDERKRVLTLFNAAPTDRKFSLPLGPPATSIKLSSDSMDFGAIRVFNGERESQHTGADFPIPAGTAVKSVAAGTVLLAEEQFFTGNTVFIDHGNGLISMNFHLAEISVKVGDELKRGQTVGTVGSTGRSTGPHLHLGLRWHAKRIDPRMLLHPTTELPDLGYAKK